MMSLRANLVLAVCLALCCITAEAGIPNLVQNHSFETGGGAEANGWSAAWGGYDRVTDNEAWHGCYVVKVQNRSGATSYAGAKQRIVLNQTSFAPVRFTARIKGSCIEDLPADKFGACLYAEIHLVNGSVVYTKNTNRTKNVGNFPWRWIGFNTGNFAEITGPIAYVDLYLMLGKTGGTVFFDSVTAEIYPKPDRGRVTFMADDGWESTFREIYPVLCNHGMPGVAAIVQNYVGLPGYMNLTQIHEMKNHGQWEIVSHGQDHTDLTTLSPENMESQYWESRKFFREKGFQVESFALPYGAYNGEIMGRGQWYWRSVRGVENGDNPPGMFPYDVRVRSVNSDTTRETWTGWIRQAEANHHWLILLFHHVTATPTAGNGIYYVTPTTVHQIVDVVFESNVKVVTYKQGLDTYSMPPTQNAVIGWELY